MIRNGDSKKIGIILFTFLTVVLIMLMSIRVYAQVSGATLTGTVSDPSGAVIPNAQVSIQNVSTGEIRSVTTDTAGLYTAPNLLVGNYQVTVTAAGFSTEVRSGITLAVGAQQLLNIRMSVGQVSQKVEVTAEATPVQLASSEISGVVSSTAVSELPLNGRDWTQLATLQPGVVSIGSIQSNPLTKERISRGFGMQMSISGSRPQENNYRIDGISVNDYENGGPGSVEGSTLGVDSVQEFSVVMSNYSAEYGRTTGGIINAITKSGTNQFHGDAFEFLRNSALDAKNFFDPQTIPAFRRNQFGAAVGGPIQKDHTFFFADYEGTREVQGITVRSDVPSPAARSGLLCSIPQPGVCSPHQVTGAFNPDPVTGIDRAVLPFLGLWALPNDGLLGNGDTGLFQFNDRHAVTENSGTARLDRKFSDKDSVFSSFAYDSAVSTQPDNNDQTLGQTNTQSARAAIEETHTFSSKLVNSARFGYSRSAAVNGIGVTAINPLAASTALGDHPGADNPQVDVGGAGNGGGALTSLVPGVNQAFHSPFVSNSFQGYDDVFLTKGIHSLKFGFAVERIQLNHTAASPAGDVSFGSLNAFLTNQPSTYNAPLPNLPFPGFGFRSTIFGGYVQDDVHLRPSLTVNLGLRYEMSTVPTEIKGRLTALRKPTDAAQSPLGSPIWKNPTLRNFQPRVGFAWDPFRNGKTSVRGAFGIFDVLPLPFMFGQISGNIAPYTNGGSVVNLSPGSFPTGEFNLLASQVVAGTGLEYAYIDPNPKLNYVLHWNLNVQRQLMPHLAGTLAYVGSRGVHQPFREDDANTTLPTMTSAGALWPSPIGSGTVLSPTVGRMDALLWNNDSFFQGFEAQVVKSMSHGFQVQGSYTWSKATDQGAGADNSDPFLSSLGSLFFFLPRYGRGPADFNITNNLVINYVWTIPTSSSFHGPAAWVANGWELGGILTVKSGLPFTPLIGGDPLGLNATHAIAYPDILRGQGCASLVNPGNANNYIKLQCFGLPMATPAIAAQCVPFSAATVPGTCQNLLGNGGRNEINGPGLVNFDFSLFKNNKIKENLNLQFRAEFFNVLNRPNFEAPIDNSTLFDQTGAAVGGAGLIDATSTSSRQIQVALKLIF